MLSEEKVRKMIRLSDYENGLGSTDLKRTCYQKTDYVRLQVIRSALSVLVAAFLAALLFCLYHFNEILYQAFSLPWKKWLITGGAGVAAVLVFSVIITCVRASRHYDESRERSQEYYATMKDLIQLYEREEQGQEEEQA